MFGAGVTFTFKETYPLSRLQNIIDNVWENDSSYIYDDYKYDPSVDADMVNGIIVNKTITIDGKGATIDLDHKTRGFYVNAPNVIIKNIKIINGNLGNGGMGGAIFFNSKNGDIINATFEGNTADYGGAVAVTEKGVTVTNSTFKNNYANERGGAIYVTTPGLSYSHNLFESNHAAYGEYASVEGNKMSVYAGANNIYINNTITGIGGRDDEITPSYNPEAKVKQFTTVNHKNYAKQVFHDKIIVKSNGKEIPLSNNLLTLGILNSIFNQNFINGHLLVYIDGKLVFNGTTTDDLTQIIYNLINLLSGNHEVKVEFTDSEGNTNTYTESITV
jgi:predicted outer membrane repeat protein